MRRIVCASVPRLCLCLCSCFEDFLCGLVTQMWADSFFSVCPAVLGVTKAVGHINDTLGPALIQSVSSRAESAPFLTEMVKQN